MTTHYREAVRCSVCGVQNEFTGIGSTNAFGSSDLDGRPPEMHRSTMFAWVQRCPDCGYCASDLSISHPKAQEVMGREEYRDQMNDPAYPELANSFLCKALVDRESKEFAAATSALVHAAWACDDSHKGDQATACRKRAADMLRVAEEHGQNVADESGASTAMRK